MVCVLVARYLVGISLRDSTKFTCWLLCFDQGVWFSNLTEKLSESNERVKLALVRKVLNVATLCPGDGQLFHGTGGAT